MGNKDSDELNSLTLQVLDYYKRYSQNHNLSSYLRGELPVPDDRNETDTFETKVNNNTQTRPPLIGCDNDENDINISNIIIDDQVCNPSPTSSITSTRKLEWDNLADIGYGNCEKQKNLHKSLSLPVLTALEKIELDHKLRLSPEGNVADNATQTQPIFKNSSPESVSTYSCKKVSSISSTSTPTFKDSPHVIDSTSSFSKTKTATTETDYSDAECIAINNEILKVHENIGLPMAESTPNNANAYKENNIVSEKKSLHKIEKATQFDQQKQSVSTTDISYLAENKNNMYVSHENASIENSKVHELKSVTKYLQNNIKHLSLTKPIMVECANYKEISDKVVQTSASKIIKTTSVSVQTEQYIPTRDEQLEENKVYPIYKEKQTVEYIIHGYSREEPSVRSLGTNTDSDMLVSQCNSFKYLFGANIREATNSISNKSGTSPLSNPSSDKCISNESNLKKMYSKSNLALVTLENERTLSSNVTDLSSKSSPLADLITTKLSKHMIGDVERSISVLQKLLKSKKYDKVTKQYYIKKIVQKIVNYDYSSESSVNSDLPSQTSDDNQNDPGKSNTKTSIESNEELLLDQPVQATTMSTIVKNEKFFKLKKKKQLDMRTFSTEILPEQPVKSKNMKAQLKQQHPKLKDSRFTIISNHKNKNSDEILQIGDTNFENIPSPRSSPQSAIETSNPSSNSNSFRNWKEELTLSEKLLEHRKAKLHCGDGSSNESQLLLNFAKKERENQINWINNEINHLNKLKNMLQKKEEQSEVTEKFTKPQIEEMIGKNQTTSVYVITTEKSGRSSESSVSNSLSVKSAPETNLNRKCKCLFNRNRSSSCDLRNCPFLKYHSEKSLNTRKLDKMLRRDMQMLPHLSNSKEHQHENDIENAKLIASEIYKCKASNSYVRRFVFEMPLRNADISSQKYQKILCESCNVNADMQNAKLIKSEVAAGTLPNTCIRRYVFEIPVYPEETSSVKSLKHSTAFSPRRSSLSSQKKKSSTSKESTFSKISKIETKNCECRNEPLAQTCKCENVNVCKCFENKRTIEFSRNNVDKFKSSDILCLCEIGRSKNNTKASENFTKNPLKVLKTDILSDPKKQYRVSVKETSTGDSVSYDEFLDKESRQKQKTGENAKISEDLQGIPTVEEIPKFHNHKITFQKENNQTSGYVQISETEISKSPSKAEDVQTSVNEMIQSRRIFSQALTIPPFKAPSGDEKSTQLVSSDILDFKDFATQFSKVFSGEVKAKQLLSSFTEPYVPVSGGDEKYKQPSSSDKLDVPLSFGEELPHKINKATGYTEEQVIRPHSESNKLHDVLAYLSLNYERDHSVNADGPSRRNKASQYENQSLDNDENEEVILDTKKSTATRKPVKHKTNNKQTETSSSYHPNHFKREINNERSESSSSYDSSSTLSSDESTYSVQTIPRICLCCNKADTKYRSVLRGLPDKLRDALCEPCYARNQEINWPHSKPYYTYPGHVCSCYTVLKTETVRNIQKTVDELQDLETDRNICSCTHECRILKHGGRRRKHKKSIAYTLTLEDVKKPDLEKEEKHKKHNKKPLEEVHIKIPRFVKKSRKDKDNEKRYKHERQRRHKKHHNSKPLTLQDYLWTNRPNFIADAEQRRKAMIKLGFLREERCQKYKQLLAMSNGLFPDTTNIDNKISKPRMFTSQEIKQITAKNYKKLPEVQKKLEENRNKQIKKANKILADIYNKKLRDNVLKGRLNLSTNTSVIKLP